MSDVEDAAGAAEKASRRLAARSASRGRKRLKVVAFIILMVLAGVIIGAGGAVVYFNKKMYRRPPRPHDLGRVIIERLDDVVGLSEAETAALNDQIDRLMGEVEQIRTQSFNAIQGKFDESNAKLRVMLGEDRYRKWEEYKDEHMPKRRHRNR